MTLNERIESFASLGDVLISSLEGNSSNPTRKAILEAYAQNAWFTPEFTEQSIRAIAGNWLLPNNLRSWIEGYPNEFFSPLSPKKVAIVMAGNVPLVGFHDFLCTLIAGHKAMCKVSSKDGGLIQMVAKQLIQIDSRFSPMIDFFEEKLEGFDAVIATGSNNTARYFDYYFGKYPNIIRKNRHSIAVLTGNETREELELLADDVFLYFGLGCRSVSKLFFPEDFDAKLLLEAFSRYGHLINHSKYANNYDYHRAVYLMNRTPHLDNGFILLKPDEGLGSPVGVLFYQNYKNIEHVNDWVEASKENLQCVVSNSAKITRAIPYGSSQQPHLTDYADGVDTIEFLCKI